MTYEKLETYLTNLLPSLRRKAEQFVRDGDNNINCDDICQQAIIYLWKNKDKIEANNNQEFTNLFWSYFHTIRKQTLFNNRDAIARGRTTHEGYNLSIHTDPDDNKDDEQPEIQPRTYENPWDNQRIQALEYIELVDNPRYRQVLILYFIEGYTMQEMSKLLNISAERARQLIDKGIRDLKKAHDSIIAL